MTYAAAPDRYDDKMRYRRCGRSTQRAILRRAFDLGVSQFDLANN